jgi:Flp pilus assembly protein TadG
MVGTANDITRRFARDRRGAIGVLFALMALPLFGIVAAAIDYGRAFSTRSALQSAADAATLAVIDEVATATDEAIEAALRVFLDSNLGEDLAGVPFTLDIPKERDAVSVRIERSIPTSLLAMTGLRSMDVGVTSRTRQPTPIVAATLPGKADVERSLDQITRSLGAAPGGIGNFAGGSFKGGPTGAGVGAMPDLDALSRGLGIDLGAVQAGGGGVSPAARSASPAQPSQAELQRQLGELERIMGRLGR